MKKEDMKVAVDGKGGPKFDQAAKGGSLGMGLAHQEKKVNVESIGGRSKEVQRSTEKNNRV